MQRESEQEELNPLQALRWSAQHQKGLPETSDIGHWDHLS